jgi:serine/threonine protein kinase
MALTPGTSLGVYRVGDLLGKGGMGEVYRARDEKLGRDVALKVLPEEFASDPDRFVRFEREARLLASLNPPNIAGIHGCFAVRTGTASEGRTEPWAGRGMPTRKATAS